MTNRHRARTPGYEIEWHPDAEAEVDGLRAFDARPIFEAIEELKQQAEVKTRLRKELREPLEELPDASWQVTVGEHRVLYQVKVAESGDESAPRTVRILRVILKGRKTTSQAVGRKP